MKIATASALVTGGASGLGRATAARLAERGARVVIVDLPGSNGGTVAADIGAVFAPADILESDTLDAALAVAEADGPLRILVHCAGRGGALRLVERDGTPGSLEVYESVVRVNLVGTFNVLRLAASRMAKAETLDGERGVCVLTSSIAAFEGQIGQVPYASAKAGIAGMTIVAARDLASKRIRVCTIAPGPFDTPILARLPEKVRTSLAESIPHPTRLGAPDEFASLAEHIIENVMLNGEVIRLDGAVRMPPK